jgi:hypothetical protein
LELKASTREEGTGGKMKEEDDDEGGALDSVLGFLAAEDTLGLSPSFFASGRERRLMGWRDCLKVSAASTPYFFVRVDSTVET